MQQGAIIQHKILLKQYMHRDRESYKLNTALCINKKYIT
jgi:hypothetical protein